MQKRGVFVLAKLVFFPNWSNPPGLEVVSKFFGGGGGGGFCPMNSIKQKAPKAPSNNGFRVRKLK